MKIFRNHFFIMFIAIVSVLSFTLGIYADELRQDITATLCKDIKITYNGEEYVARDSNGSVTYPIVYNGATYLPVRGLANLNNNKVTWNGETRTIGLMSPDYVPASNSSYIPETELNDSVKNANIFELNSKMKGIVGESFIDTGYYDEYDYLKFTLKEPGEVTFTIKTDEYVSGFEFQLKGIDSEGGYEFLHDNKGIDEEGVLVYKDALDAGIYYACLTSDEKIAYKIENVFEPINNTSDSNNDDIEFFST